MKRIWTFGLLCILLTIFFVGHNISSQRSAALQKARSDVADLVQFVTMDLSRNFFGLSQVFLGIHNVLEIAPEKTRPFSPNVRHVLDRLKETNPFVTALLIMDSAGEIVHWTGSGDIPPVRDRNYFTVHKDNNPPDLFVSTPFDSRKHPGQWVFAASRAYREPDGSLGYVIAAIIDLNYISLNYADLRLSPGEAITLVSPQGDIYMRKPGNESLRGKNVPQIAERLKGMGKNGFVRITSHLDSRTRGLSFARIDDFPLVVAASYDEQITLDNWRKNSLLVVGFGFAVVITFFLLTLVSVRSQREQGEAREMLQKQAITDPLTQLANRRRAVECARLEIKKAHRQGTPLSFVLMDLDHFKKVNDSCGHEKGDLVLRRVAEILNQLCRQTDVVSRFGGEEFLMILPDTDLSGAELSAEKIRKALADDESVEDLNMIHVTASFGVAQWHEAELEFKDTLRRADRALYVAKSRGRNRVVAAEQDPVETETS